VKGLIKMRKEHPAFRMKSAKEIADNLQFIDAGQKGLITYIINGQKVNDRWKKIFIVLNSDSKKTVSIPNGIWRTATLNNHFEDVDIPKLVVEPYSCTILYQD
jgi:pullulanase